MGELVDQVVESLEDRPVRAGEDLAEQSNRLVDLRRGPCQPLIDRLIGSRYVVPVGEIRPVSVKLTKRYIVL